MAEIVFGSPVLERTPELVDEFELDVRITSPEDGRTPIPGLSGSDCTLCASCYTDCNMCNTNDTWCGC
ncbi:hypothetical protein EPA93_05955 [Ktedonosporobacter rubrisoli]|uniref:Uncharacterized protein n=1 Tax=Ktedonosporobacter rubrisoli TaxID=2509675 RepID=A0A4V0YYA8_KTERU|nr:hypothetical protein [Ktedonosporobacter rubrisoli]QBD75571.1 hypothetical protein EPA93_05955 [Ktedonosporobacter rubrisoli]